MDHIFKCKSHDFSKTYMRKYLRSKEYEKQYIDLLILRALIIKLKLISYSSSKEKHILCDKSIKRIKLLVMDYKGIFINVHPSDKDQISNK